MMMRGQRSSLILRILRRILVLLLLPGFVRLRDHQPLKLVPQRGRRVQDTIHHCEHGLIVLLYQLVLDLIEPRQLDLEEIY